MSKKRQNYMHRCDVLFSKIVRQRDGQRCVVAGWDTRECKGNLQCAHIIPRGQLEIRMVLDNAVAACQAHHVYYEHRRAEWDLLIESMFPGRLDRLRKIVQDHLQLGNQKIDWPGRLAELKRIAKNLEIA